jgi:uncharacterized radical SAM protein YgiQ
MTQLNFLPTSKEEMDERGWFYYDFLVVTGDAYVDHPSFGTAIISRLLESQGYRVAVLGQPAWDSADDFKAMGRPRYGVMITAGNIDSMVSLFTAAKKKRSDDAYIAGKYKRPLRATIVFSNRAREAFGDLPIILGGLEASLRRFAHYDYIDDSIRRSILVDAQADILAYGMAESAVKEIANRLASGTPVSEITDVRGTAYLGERVYGSDVCECPSFEDVASDKKQYAMATKIQYDEHDFVTGKKIIQQHGKDLLIVNPPSPPLTREELDAVAQLPYCRTYHPKYEQFGGVDAIEEVRFSVIHNRGCFGNCNFCSLAFHQGQVVTSRSQDSVVKEVQGFVGETDFKGYVHDVGGPTANFRNPSCKKQIKSGMCRDRSCLAPTPCPNLIVDHKDYLKLLRRLREISGIKKVFIRSGIRYDYLLQDKDQTFFSELVDHHISGQLKVAPEHCVAHVLDYMGKPHIEAYEKFQNKFQELNKRHNKNQYLIPYLMSSHPGSTLNDAVTLAEYLHKKGYRPEQVQDFYPTPGTISTCMYYTGIDPRTMKNVYVAKTSKEKELQRALLQWNRPAKRSLVIEALKKAGREDLIGFGKGCLVRPNKPQAQTQTQEKNTVGAKPTFKTEKKFGKPTTSRMHKINKLKAKKNKLKAKKNKSGGTKSL